MSTHTAAKCPGCRGKGIIGTRTGNVYSEIKCGSCNGTGERPKSKLKVLSFQRKLDMEAAAREPARIAEAEIRKIEDERRAAEWELVQSATQFQRGYCYEVADVIEWKWRPEYQRWGALVRFSDGAEAITYPKP